MKAKVRFLSISLLICLLLSPLQTSLAAEMVSNPSSDDVLSAVQPLIEAQSLYDEITNTEIAICDVEWNDEGRAYVDCFLTLTMSPKANSPEDTPFVRGMMAATQAKNVENRFPRAQSIKLELMQTIVSNYVEDLKQNFHGSVDATFGLRLMLASNGNITSVYGLNDEGIFPVEDYYPKTSDELFSEGWAYVINRSTEIEPGSDEIQALQRYYRYDAGHYARTYTSNATSYCPHGEAKQNTSKYNSAYNYHCHADCANYMSQAIKYAGLSTNSTWKAESYAWVNVGGLIDYLISKSYINKCTFADLKTGILIVCNSSTSPRNHIVMCTYKDSTKQLLSGHTTDRLNYSFTASYGGSPTYYDFTIAVSGSQYGGNPTT